MISDQKYSRHILLKEIGRKGQEKIQKSKVLIVGMGGIGSPVALNLVLAGVGKIGLVDDDYVEESNLQRQIIYKYADIDEPKVLAAARNLQQLNEACEIQTYQKKITRNLENDFLQDYDYVIDGTDDLDAKFYLNELCLQYKKIFFSGSFLGWRGYYALYKAGIDRNFPCFACFHGDELELKQEKACYNQGVIASGVISLGSMLASDILKEICQIGKEQAGKIMRLDFLRNQHHQAILRKRTSCKYCSSV